MSKFYVIQWKSKVNGRAGRGTKQFEKTEAEQLLEELNREYPQIVHEIVEVQAASELPDAEQPTSEPIEEPSTPAPSTPMLTIA